MRKLNVDLTELEFIFDDASWETNYYLDLETGQVVAIMDETRWELESIYEEKYDEEKQQMPPLDDILRERDLLEWQKDALLEADRVEIGYGVRYISVPKAESHQGYRDMERFIVTVEDERLQDRLWRAISGRGAFRYFKDVLYDYPRERERWFQFKADRLRQRVLDWLASEGIEPIIEAVQSAETAPAQPSTRDRLISEALAFVREVWEWLDRGTLIGVTRIALIGSLTTSEPDPKDVDLLVTITDQADLARLAKLARKLQGHAQSFNRGADVFLADPQDNYLGRTCPWKRCGPRIRSNCDALHCGRRPYLHDDLNAVRLPKSLIIAPPIELWPHVVTRASMPEDIEQDLIAALER